MQGREKVRPIQVDCAPAQTVMKWTVEDYHRLIETGLLARRRVQLIAGDIVEMAPEGPTHSYTIQTGADHLRQRLSGKALVSEAHPITLPTSEPEPDIAVVKLPRSQYKDRHPYPEDVFFLVEIANSTLNYDLTVKKSLYAGVGIPEYWVVDVVGKKVYVFRQLEKNVYTDETVFDTDSIRPLAFPSASIRVAAFWD